MSICSDVTIDRKEAEKYVLDMVISDYMELFKASVRGMDDHELESRLNSSTDMYYYTIENGKGNAAFELEDLKEDYKDLKDVLNNIISSGSEFTDDIIKKMKDDLDHLFDERGYLE